MNEKLFRETFSKLRASDQSKEELLNRMENHENKRHGAFRVMRGILVAAAAVCLLTTAAFAGNGLISSWWSRDAQDEYLYRGNFEAARRVEGDVPGTFADGMVQLPYFSVGGKVLVNDEGRVLFYVFAAENDVTHIDEIIDITDLLTASEDGTYRYPKSANKKSIGK